MGNIFEWYCQGVEEQRIAGMHDRGKMKYVIPVYILLQVGLYFYFKDSLHKHGALIIGGPIISALAMIVYVRWNQRNVPGTGGYIFTHLSKTARIIIVFMVIFSFFLFLVLQCKQYGFSLSSICFERIFIYGNR
ncbi:hypothetical protein CO051_00900 [Candidatus Roizmanbacteria bacterium CG_4_9_14_0_2_um_filter_39_13]|uniref:Uncharacterized protein n=2 Tax=Candidatus Roizmaniibacteriota TaxID=1752723 RepID=A0A2M8F3H4_9BACT|nr:MAG: hypothetical protein COY15_05265 [Candidatus Roizmanbacteria bacterium CG_4_10_14_0_2_um_filter_39_12]PJC33846.1 MAG: hypothetical protein CO051_00900 [Candidatus Roizmanbacteria bacterium CG_4_9_14_0_2_um_filter_39_13]PJE61725.1 MAG: hypothetical protein COU87_03030 [Candidatus Roizmanbacteria bacterium CG10_big_fil_rev_8_21_14_0_10_39_12]